MGVAQRSLVGARTILAKFENFWVRGDRVLVKSLISNKGAKINEIEFYMVKSSKEGKLGFCFTQANSKTKVCCIKS
jgi:hypothetical protein